MSRDGEFVCLKTELLHRRLKKKFFFDFRFGAPRFGGSRAGPLSGKKFGNPGEKLVKKKWNLDELPKFEKNFYQEHPDLARRTAVSNFMWFYQD